jgi:hypothetical protein
MHGSMINPSPKLKVRHGYDSDAYVWHNTAGKLYPKASAYDPLLNVALNVSANNLLIIAPGSSLLSTISREQGARPQMKAAAVLTVLQKVPAKGSFRPSYSGSNKKSSFNISQVNMKLLKSHPKLSKTPSISTAHDKIRRVWPDHIPDWLARYLHPVDNMPAYGRDMSGVVSEVSLMLHLDFTEEEKKPLLISFLQLGIDLWGIINDGGEKNWFPNGGHTNGRKWPILFAGLMFNDTQMKNIGARSGAYLYKNGNGPGNPPEDYIFFNEDAQTFYVKQADIDRTNGSKWTPDKRNVGRGEFTPYSVGDIGLPEWGIRHATNPLTDNAHFNSVYRVCCTTNSYGGFVLAARMMGAETLWNNSALFDYVDRYIYTENKALLPSSVNQIWHQYRPLYGDIWER